MLKNSSIQTLRAIATLLVIGLHITHDGSIGTAQEFYQWLNRSLNYVRMPIFTVISGYLYAFKFVGAGQYSTFIKGKSRRLLIPLAVVASAEYFAKAIQNGLTLSTLTEWPMKVLILPYEHYWFIQSVFIVIAVTGGLDRAGLLSTAPRWFATMLGSLVIYFYMRTVDFDYFGISGASYLLPYFIFGVALKRFPLCLQNKKIAAFMAITFATGIALQQFGLAGQLSIDMHPRSILGICTGISSCYLLFWIKPDARPLAAIGHYSFSIYLFQGFTTPIARIAADSIHLEAHAYFIFVVATATVLGVLTEKAITRTKFLRLPLLGVR